MQHSSIITEIDGKIGWIIFNRPEKKNALSLAMWKAIPEILSDYEQNPEIRVIVIRGNGNDAFVAGADISEFKENRSDAEKAKIYHQATQNAFSQLRQIRKPVVAMIHGFCFGGGCALALNCDLRIATTSSLFCLPPAKLGLGYGYDNVEQVVKVVGMASAKEMLYTGKRYSGEEALRMGLIHQCVEDSDLLPLTQHYVKPLLENAPLAIQSLKFAIEESVKDVEKRQIEAVHQAMEQCYHSHDYQEGYQAFLEKRKPIFTGI